MCCQLYLYSSFDDYVENSVKITARWILVNISEIEFPAPSLIFILQLKRFWIWNSICYLKNSFAIYYQPYNSLSLLVLSLLNHCTTYMTISPTTLSLYLSIDWLKESNTFIQQGYALNWSKEVTVKTITLLQKYYISKKCCSFLTL